METPIRTFKKDEMVLYKPWDGCSPVDVAGPGRVEEVLTGDDAGSYNASA